MERTALLFPGQGSQYTGMGNLLHGSYSSVRSVFEEACDVLCFDIRSLCFAGEMDVLTQTKFAQPAIYTVSVAMYRALMEEYGGLPYRMAGHSLGEISALTCSGAIRFSDGLRIVKRRGELMQEVATFSLGGMVALSGIGQTAIERVLEELRGEKADVEIACYNSPNQFVLSGNTVGLQTAEVLLQAQGANVTHLNVSAPFHHQLMEQAAVLLKEELLQYEFHAFGTPVISNLDAALYKDTTQIVQSLARQLVSPVRWTDTMDALESDGIEVIIEVGPKSVLRNLMRKSKPSIGAYTWDQKTDREELDKRRRQHSSPTDWIRTCISFALCTKNNCTDSIVYAEGVKEPVHWLKQLLYRLEKEQREPQKEELSEALNQLLTVLHTKQLPENEKRARLKKLWSGTADIGLRSTIEHVGYPNRKKDIHD